MKAARRSRRGSSLLEAAITVTMLALVMGSALGVVQSTRGAHGTASMTMDLQFHARKAVNDIAARIRSSGVDRITPPGMVAPLSTSSIDFVRAVDLADDEIVWGAPERIEFQYTAADPDDGTDDDGNGVVDDGIVVFLENPDTAGEERTTLCRYVRESLEGEVPGNALDDNGNGLIDEPGLSFDYGEDRVTIRLSLERVDGSGRPHITTVRRTVALRNGDDGGT